MYVLTSKTEKHDKIVVEKKRKVRKCTKHWKASPFYSYKALCLVEYVIKMCTILRHMCTFGMILVKKIAQLQNPLHIIHCLGYNS